MSPPFAFSSASAEATTSADEDDSPDAMGTSPDHGPFDSLRSSDIPRSSKPPRRGSHVVGPVSLGRSLDGTFQLKREWRETGRRTVQPHHRIIHDPEVDTDVAVDGDGKNREPVVVGVLADQVDAAGRDRFPAGGPATAGLERPCRGSTASGVFNASAQSE